MAGRRRKPRLLPDPREEAALRYFLREDEDIAAAWWFFCLSCAEHKPTWSRQLEQLAARMGRPVTHVDGVLAALQFCELSMRADPAYRDQWEKSRSIGLKLENYQQGELGRLIDRLAVRRRCELEEEHKKMTEAEKEASHRIATMKFRQATGADLDELSYKIGVERLNEIIAWFIVVSEIQDMIYALSI